jgi:hypothetical protein
MTTDDLFGWQAHMGYTYGAAFDAAGAIEAAKAFAGHAASAQ